MAEKETKISRGDFTKGVVASLIIGGIVLASGSSSSGGGTGTDLDDIVDNPSGIDQTIVPLTDNVPLTTKGFPGGTSKTHRFFDSTSPTQQEAWYFDKDGNLVLRIPSGASRKLIIQDDALLNVLTFLWVDSLGQVRIGDPAQVHKSIKIVTDWIVDTPGGGHLQSNEFWNLAQTLRGILYSSGLVAFGDTSAQHNLRSANKIEDTDQVPFTLFTLEALSSDPTGAGLNLGREWLRSDLKKRKIVVDTVPTVKQYAFSDDIFIQANMPAGVNMQINDDETQASITVPNADTNIKTSSLGANTFSKVKTSVDEYIQVAVTSTLQTVSLKIKYGAAQIGNTMKFQAPTAIASFHPFAFEAQAAQAAAVTIAVTASAPAADANTTVFVNRLNVNGVV